MSPNYHLQHRGQLQVSDPRLTLAYIIFPSFDLQLYTEMNFFNYILDGQGLFHSQIHYINSDLRCGL